MPKAQNTPVTQLRREARGSLTQQDVCDYMAEHGLDVDQVTISDFERAKYMPADKRFIPLYARLIGQPQVVVRDAFQKTQKAKTPRRRPSKR